MIFLRKPKKIVSKIDKIQKKSSLNMPCSNLLSRKTYINLKNETYSHPISKPIVWNTAPIADYEI